MDTTTVRSRNGIYAVHGAGNSHEKWEADVLGENFLRRRENEASSPREIEPRAIRINNQTHETKREGRCALAIRRILLTHKKLKLNVPFNLRRLISLGGREGG